MNAVALAPLIDKADVVRGVTFSKGDAVAEPHEGYTPVLRAGNIQGHLILDSDLVYIPEQMVSEKQRLRSGDIVMCTSSGSAEIVGKTAFADQDWSGSFGAFCAVVRPKPGKCNPRYLFHYLQTPKFREWTRNSSGVGIKNIRKSELDSYEVLFPSLDEQCRIAKILDKADEIRRKRKQALVLADDFLKSVFLEMFGDPTAAPPKFSTRPLGQLVDQKRGISYGIVQRGAHDEDGVPIVRITDIAGNVLRDTQLVRVARDLSNKYRRTILKGGELLLSIRGTVGRVAIAPSTAKGYNVSREVAVIPLLPGVDPLFVRALMLTDGAQKFMTDNVKGVAQSGINLKDVRLLPVPEVPATLLSCFQKIIVATGRVTEKSYEPAPLYESLSQRAFRGEL